MSIESRVAETMLQEESIINIAGVEYYVAPPSLATLIYVSKEIATLPTFDAGEDSAKAVSLMLKEGRNLAPLARIVAILVLGAKHIRDSRRHFWQFWKRKNKVESIARRVQYECTPGELSKVIMTLLAKMQLADFFVISVSLTNLNISKKTSETGTIAHGQ